MPPTMLKDADLGQICLRSSTCPRSNSFDIATPFGKTDSAARLNTADPGLLSHAISIGMEVNPTIQYTLATFCVHFLRSSAYLQWFSIPTKIHASRGVECGMMVKTYCDCPLPHIRFASLTTPPAGENVERSPGCERCTAPCHR